MKQIIAFCLACWFVLSVNAKSGEKQVNAQSVRQYLIARNNFIYCQLPEIWNAKSAEEISAILARWENGNERERFLAHQYYRSEYQLAEQFFDIDTVVEMRTGEGSGISGYLENMTDKQRRERTLKTEKQCRKVWEEPY